LDSLEKEENRMTSLLQELMLIIGRRLLYEWLDDVNPPKPHPMMLLSKYWIAPRCRSYLSEKFDNTSKN
jgi:hypothetical protein